MAEASEQAHTSIAASRARPGVSQSQNPADLVSRLSRFLQGLPIQFETIEPTRVIASMELGPDQHTPWGVVHGGAYTTAIESVASVGASAAVFEKGQFAVGVNNNTDFLRSMVAGKVAMVAQPLFQGSVQQLWQVVLIRVDDGKEVARGQVRLQNVPLKKPS